MKRIRSLGTDLIAVLLILIGICLLLYPDFQALQMKMESEHRQMKLQGEILKRELKQIEETKETEKDVGNDISESKDVLYQGCRRYNEKIFLEDQEGLRDVFCYEQVPVELAGLEETVFGYLEIPALSSTFPVYIGASMEKLAKGLAVLGQTSIPIGGENTHAVISGHRGWSTGPFLRDIEKLRIGDRIYLTNPWEILTYRVAKIDIIPADGMDRLLIQEGKDMLTLLTCHPYLSHGEQDRYVVYSVREEQKKSSETEKKEETVAIEETQTSEILINGKEEVPDSSADLIRLENGIRRGIALLTVVFLTVSFIDRKLKKGKRNKA